jgi:hypothetical protein
VSPDPHAVAVGHVQALGAAGLWPHVRAVEIGNEIDIYAKPTQAEQRAKGHRNMSYTCTWRPRLEPRRSWLAATPLRTPLCQTMLSPRGR